MKLYYRPNACSLASNIALREAGLRFELVKVDRKTGQAADGLDFNEVNPKGYVPALTLDNGEVLTENVAVLQYIADRNPAAKLAPAAGVPEQVLPGVLAPEALALLGELHTLGRERDHVGLAIHVDLTLELFVEFGSHCFLYFSRPSDWSAATVCGRAPTRSHRRWSCGQRSTSKLTCLPQPNTTYR